MKKLRLLLVLLISIILTLTFSACGDGGRRGPNGFVNPGDILGGGGNGETPNAADDTTNNSSKDDMQDKADLDGLSGNTSGDNAIEKEATSDVVSISESGTYMFKGTYGGIEIAASSLNLHFIFDGATITRSDGVAIGNGSGSKKTTLVITLNEGTRNSVTNDGDDVNAIHIKGSLAINGKGTLNVTSNSKSAVKVSKDIRIVDATLNVKKAINHGITAASVVAASCEINVESAGKDGINAECDGAEAFTTDDGYVSLKNVKYACNVDGDGIQADTVVYIDGGNYNIKTTGTFVQKTAENMATYGMTADDFRYKKSGNTYVKVANDETNGTLYGLVQGCKGIKVGEIEYEDKSGNTVTVTDGDYLIAITDGTFVIDSTDDAIHTNSGNLLIEGGTFNISTYDDALTSDKLTKITGGNITITKCYEGIEGAYVEISGGTISLVASDDGINAASDDKSVTAHIIISGGDITVNSSGDGLDSNGSILISGGKVTVHGPTSGGDAGMDADKGIIVNGGMLFVTSTLGMVETPASNSKQYVISYAHQSKISASSVVSLCDSNGNTLVSVTVEKECQSIIISSPDIKNGSNYSIYCGSTQMTSFTVSSIITTVGSSGSTFPGGGTPGGGPGSGGPGGRW
ncbi:MAG: carbohydrate-binding domain-containing protein [Clostridiales bacterium]|nr:carbohydrate-binding domain-containing protein [Clostridiales bacterium]